ncbi:MAG: Uma2 family endonuclease [Rhizonema sp. PD37]|nr:Uma2 family endonuclease [Rhizonema sp. PD37]
MTQTQFEPKIFTFDEFIAWYSEDSLFRYELHNGVIVEMSKPRGKHSNLTGCLIEKLLITIREIGKGGIWTIPRESIVKPSRESGYEPDIIVLNQETIGSETRWEGESIIQNATSVKLIVEVVSQCVARVPRVEATDSPVRVSSNWRDDYYDKLRDYEEMEIEEYWIVDYAALGGKKFIGNPKMPTISVCVLVEGEYQVTKFTASTQIISPAFPQFNLTAQQVFDLAN